MSALTILAIVAGILLALVVAVGVTTAVRTRVMQNRDLALAEALAGDKPPLSQAPRARGRSRATQDAGGQRSILEEADVRRGILEEAVTRWLAPEDQDRLTEELAYRWGQQDPQGWKSFIYDLIQTRRQPYAGLLLLDEEHDPMGPTPSSTATWYRDQLLSLHPAYLATRASLFERVTQLITLTIRMEQLGVIPIRRRLP